MVLDEIQKQDSFAIYGAQVIAFGAYTAIKGLTGRKPDFFVVGSRDAKPQEGLNGNLEVIDGIEVCHIDACPKDMFILVAVTELVQKEVIPFLKDNGYTNFLALTQYEEHVLMSKYYESIGRFPTLEALRGLSPDCSDWTKARASARELDLRMYEVCNHRDSILSSKPSLKEYEYPIQAGAALSDKEITELKDNTGDNISLKNRQYCEMTASYWVWKNIKCGWKGIEHYRRHLLVRPELLRNDVDVVLPLPYICYPSELYQFGRFVREDVRKALFTALKHVHPEEYDDYLKVLNGPYQYTYNMVCARNDVFDEYCRWFFEITGYMETMQGDVPDIRDTRALSYVAEVLTNIYFMTNPAGLKIYHVQKEIYV